MQRSSLAYVVVIAVLAVALAYLAYQYFNVNVQYLLLKGEYEVLKSEYINLENQYNVLQEQYNSLQNQYNNLQNTCGVQSNIQPTLQVQAMSLTGVSSGSSATLTILVSNPSSSAIEINGFTLGSLSCVASRPVQVLAGKQGVMLTITLTITNGAFTGASINGTAATCSGQQAAQVGVQYSGYLTTTNGQTYPFTVTASS